MIKYLVAFSSLALLAAVAILGSQSTNPNLTKPFSANESPGIYYWKTHFSFSPQDRALAQDHGLQQLFVRAFDVQWSPSQNDALPVAPISFPSWEQTPLHLDGLKITPVVFIDNRVFQSGVDKLKLAKNICKALEQMEKSLLQSLAPPPPNEEENPYDYEYQYKAQEIQQKKLAQKMDQWQIDCDWTPSSRQAYFDFLTLLQKTAPKKNISVTIRLHQYRDREANGIPPVEKGLLMCYNMAPAHDINTQNAIFDLSLLKGYLKAPPYPFALDAALPIFEWAAAFKQSEFVGIFKDFNLQNTTAKKSPQGHIAILDKDTTLQNKLLRAGDQIRFDGPQNQKALEDAIAILRHKTEIEQLHFFDWQPDAIQHFQLNKLFSSFYKQ